MSSPRPATTLALRVIVLTALVASLGIQVLVLQAAVRDLAGPQAVVLIAMLLVVAGILCLQAIGVSVLRFLGHVRRAADRRRRGAGGGAPRNVRPAPGTLSPWTSR